MLSDKVILVTGASSGIGAATADKIIKLGGRVYNFDKTQSDSKAEYVECDVSNLQSIQDAVGSVLEKEQAINGLFCRAVSGTASLANEKALFTGYPPMALL